MTKRWRPAPLRGSEVAVHLGPLTRRCRAAAAAAGEWCNPDGIPAGLVHDLGRMGVPNTIWDKRAPLTAGEVERVRLHPYYSDRILASVPALAGLAPMAAQHHERLDGSGYPRGSRAESLTREGGCCGSRLLSGVVGAEALPGSPRYATRSRHVSERRSGPDAWTALLSTLCFGPPATRYDATGSGRPDSRPGRWRFCDISRAACRRRRSRNAW